jgi:glycosyltransferase involved in cell wall biosynthesis
MQELSLEGTVRRAPPTQPPTPIPAPIVEPAEYDVTVVVPVYNEEGALPHVLADIFAHVGPTFEVLVVDDGSTDRTCAVAGRFPCRLIRHEQNRGKGGAMQTGIASARGRKIIFIDGDATYPASNLPAIAASLDRYDIVRCVRSGGRHNIPLLNRIGNTLFDGMLALLHQVEGADVLSGLYGLRRSDLLAMRLEASGFDIESEIVVKARARGLSTCTLPIEYNERIGEKKLDPLRDGLKITARILKLAMLVNPFLTYFVPGLLLWALALATILLARPEIVGAPLTGGGGPLVVGAMAFLAGFQLLTLGAAVNLYAAESGMARHNPLFKLLVTSQVRQASFYTGVGLAGGGVVVYLGFVLRRLLDPAAALPGEALLLALALVAWGLQLIAIAFFLSLFARSLRGPAAPALGEPARAGEIGGGQ